jgi:hypothetical protein
MAGQDRSRRWLWWAIGYAALLGTVVLSMSKARHWAIAHLSSQESIDEWRQWRDDVRRQQIDPEPVQRRVPTSDEPPALILMRDYFGLSLLGAVLFSTALYWVMAWLISGVMKRGEQVSK